MILTDFQQRKFLLGRLRRVIYAGMLAATWFSSFSKCYLSFLPKLIPGGTVQSAELEVEHGKLVWSFDIAKAGSADVIEVQVDATTGRIVSIKAESPAEQAKTAKADKKL